MATNLKKYRYALGFKLLATLFCIGGMTAVFYGLVNQAQMDALQDTGHYKTSIQNCRDMNTSLNSAYNLFFDGRSVETIKAGTNLSEERMADEKNTLTEEKNQAIDRINEQYNGWMDRARSSNDSAEVQRLSAERRKRVAEAELLYQGQAAAIKQKLIDEDLHDYEQDLQALNAGKAEYLVTFPDGRSISNNKALLGRLPEAIASDYSTYVYVRDGKITSTYPNSSEFGQINLPTKASLFVGMTPEVVDQLSAKFDEERTISRKALHIMFAGLAAFLIGLAYNLYAAGRTPSSETITLNLFDRLYLDLNLCLYGLTMLLCMGLLNAIFNYFNTRSLFFYQAALPIIALGTLMGLYCLISASKRLKRREFLQHMLISKILSGLGSHIQGFVRGIAAFLHKGQAHSKALRQIIAYALVNLAGFLMGGLLIAGFGPIGLLMAIAVLGAINWWAFKQLVRHYDSLDLLVTSTQRIKNGDLSYRIPDLDGTAFSVLGQQINSIAGGLSAAVENEVRSERMKAELITNVSHDLKTPLTAIISYVDLLKREGLSAETAPGYLDILDQKSQRLKTLTEDLFEAAKASSGNMPVSIEPVDFVELLTQGLGELSDQIEQSGLDFKIALPKERLLIEADGKLLWRVMENLLSNVFKYALPNSRVYLDVQPKDTLVCVTLKNISAFALNIPAHELMERFKRGDESRTSEGSGLGLSIARSLVEIQKGQFTLEIDGDLFKVTLCFPKSI